MVKYKACVTQIGPLVAEFIAHGVLVFFGATAPEELTEFAIIHDGLELIEPIVAGDTVHIGDEAFQVLAVGEVANKNLSNLGHFVLKCNGQTEPEMPGDVCLEAKPLPVIKVGTMLIISHQNNKE
jgi:glucitol/sorbitol PTS system EIIA component